MQANVQSHIGLDYGDVEGSLVLSHEIALGPRPTLALHGFRGRLVQPDFDFDLLPIKYGCSTNEGWAKKPLLVNVHKCTTTPVQVKHACGLHPALFVSQANNSFGVSNYDDFEYPHSTSCT